MSKERLTEKTKDCFGYRLKDGSDAEVGFFKDYDAFYSHMMVVRALGEYEDLEEQGLLLRLPCKVGDMVYTVCSWGIESGVVGSIEIISDRVFVNNIHGAMIGEAQNIFLTQSEAEEKLRELEGK